MNIIHEEDVAQVYDFIGHLNVKGEREATNQTDLEHLSKDKELIRQVQKSREDRDNRLIMIRSRD